MHEEAAQTVEGDTDWLEEEEREGREWGVMEERLRATGWQEGMEAGRVMGAELEQGRALLLAGRRAFPAARLHALLETLSPRVGEEKVGEVRRKIAMLQEAEMEGLTALTPQTALASDSTMREEQRKVEEGRSGEDADSEEAEVMRKVEEIVEDVAEMLREAGGSCSAVAHLKASLLRQTPLHATQLAAALRGAR